MMYIIIYDKIKKKETTEYFQSYYFFRKRYYEIKRNPYLAIIEMSNMYD